MRGSLRRRFVAMALGAFALVPDAGANLISNADFSLGNVGFDTDYSFSPGNVTPQGAYDLVTDPNDSHKLAASFGDHTSEDGLMLMINGATIPNQIVWSQQVNVTPGQDYTFSLWVASWFPSSPASLRVRINSIAIAPDFEVSAVTGTWMNFAATWNSGSDTVAIISIIDQETAAGGNDFVLDDIAFDLTNTDCGNGILDIDEECDGGVGCVNCFCDPGFEPSVPPSLDCQSTCGNGSIDPGEQCDGGLGCNECLCDADFEPTIPPSLDCQPTCGNGIVDPGEECDGMDDTACPGACLSDCTCSPYCGNGVCGPGEDSCNCPDDCGTPQTSETPGLNCSDGLDNDCDGDADCSDPDCEGDCEGVPSPTVSEWGMTVLILALLAGIALKFRRSRTT